MPKLKPPPTLESLAKDVELLNIKTDRLEIAIAELKATTTVLKATTAELKATTARLSSNMELLNQKMDKVLQILDSMLGDFKRFDEERTVIAYRQSNHSDRIEKLEISVFGSSQA